MYLQIPFLVEKGQFMFLVSRNERRDLAVLHTSHKKCSKTLNSFSSSPMGGRAFSSKFSSSFKLSCKLFHTYLMDLSDLFQIRSKGLFFHILVIVSNSTSYTFPNIIPTIFSNYDEYYTKLQCVKSKLTTVAQALWMLGT